MLRCVTHHFGVWPPRLSVLVFLASFPSRAAQYGSCLPIAFLLSRCQRIHSIEVVYTHVWEVLGAVDDGHKSANDRPVDGHVCEDGGRMVDRPGRHYVKRVCRIIQSDAGDSEYGRRSRRRRECRWLFMRNDCGTMRRNEVQQRRTARTATVKERLKRGGVGSASSAAHSLIRCAYVCG